MMAKIVAVLVLLVGTGRSGIPQVQLIAPPVVKLQCRRRSSRSWRSSRSRRSRSRSRRRGSSRNGRKQDGGGCTAALGTFV